MIPEDCGPQLSDLLRGELQLHCYENNSAFGLSPLNRKGSIFTIFSTAPQEGTVPEEYVLIWKRASSKCSQMLLT